MVTPSTSWPRRSARRIEERLDQGLAQLGQLVDRMPELGVAQLDDPPIFDRPAGDQAGPAAEHVDVAAELSGMGHRDDVGDALRMPDDLDRALEHHEEGAVAVAFLEQDLPGAHLTGMTPGGECRDILALEGGKGNFVIAGRRLFSQHWSIE